MLARIALAGSAIFLLTTSTAPSHACERKHEFSAARGSDRGDGESRLAYVLVRKSEIKREGSTRRDSYTTGSGETDDYREANRLRDRVGADLLWVRLGDDRYMIRDEENMAELENTLLPQEMLGREQGRLGRQQGRLGREQGRLGREQALLGARQGRLQTRIAQLSAQIARRAAERRDAGDLEQEMSAMAGEQGEIGRRQQELGELQAWIGEQQAELGQRQGELGAQQGAMAREINHKVEALVRRALEEGLAERIG